MRASRDRQTDVSGWMVDVDLGRLGGQHLGSRAMDWFFFSKVKVSFWRGILVVCRVDKKRDVRRELVW